ncbi:Ribose transport system permease protein RbsC [Caulifigura coniformis]|uniref:Ribose transport system permease protein RbsC n=1 Tax=Caulifigura coniformis TaxID=2527983 RepID=A0A517SDK7_9PLAN|nr:ABC transporter permease [Caulifigura coniformis]QDT54206.1 Ribose transport system permease protein RbsC [Caulifigura coniformis]
MTRSPGRYFSDYGMVGVLLILCLFFSAVTLSERPPTKEKAAAQVSSTIQDIGKSPSVLIAGGDQPLEKEFVQLLEARLQASGARVLGVAQGEPKDARRELERLAALGEKLDAIACTGATANWLLFQDVAAEFPALGAPRVVSPHGQRWPTFLSSSNLLNIANQIAVIAILAIGMTIVIITGGIDLSVGSLLALSAVVSTRLVRDVGGGVNAAAGAMVGACFAGIAVAGVIGAFSGLMITRFRIPPFIVTLAMMLVASGLAFTLSAGESIYQVPESFVRLGRGTEILGLPNAVVLMLALYLAAQVLMSRTVLGRHFYCVGGNRTAAWLSGVRVERVLLVAYVISGLLAGLGGVIMASQLKSGAPTYGAMYELYVIAAVVVGGASLSGGEGRMFGTLVGAFTIAVIQNGMNLMNVQSYTQKVVLGLVILGAVVFDKLRH